MDRLSLNSVPKPLTAPTTVGPAKPPPNGAGPGFAIDAVSVKISFDVTVLQSIGAPGQPSADHLRERVRAFVKEVFERNGIAYREMSEDEAKAAVAEGGEWSPENVARRIVDFVRPLANGAPGREELLRGAVERGLKEAEAAWGDRLPEIADETMELVRAGLDELFAPPAAAERPPRVDAQA